MCPGLIIPQPVGHAPLYSVNSYFCSCLTSIAQGCSQKPDLETETTFKLSMRIKICLLSFHSIYLKKQVGTNPWSKIAQEGAVFAAFGINWVALQSLLIEMIFSAIGSTNSFCSQIIAIEPLLFLVPFISTTLSNLVLSCVTT